MMKILQVRLNDQEQPKRDSHDLLAHGPVQVVGWEIPLLIVMKVFYALRILLSVLALVLKRENHVWRYFDNALMLEKYAWRGWLLHLVVVGMRRRADEMKVERDLVIRGERVLRRMERHRRLSVFGG
jgi:hypothetical protein